MVNRQFCRGDTTHILVDNKVVKSEKQLVDLLKAERFTTPFEGVKLLTQKWLTDSLEDRELKPSDDYEIKVNHDALAPNELPFFKEKTSKLDLSDTLKLVKDPEDKNSIKERLKTTKRSGDIDEEEKTVKKLKRVDLMEDQLRAKNHLKNPNQRTIEILARMADEVLLQGEPFKAKSYRTAIETLSKTNSYVSRFHDAKKLPGIGESIAKKIEEIVKTDKLAALDEVEESEESKLIKLFSGIYAVGPVTTRRWIMEGMKSLDDIAKRKDLMPNQRLGLKYYNDWNEKIPRDECSLHNEYVQNLFEKIDPKVELTIGGSYRRGQQDCGDVDFIVTKPDAEISQLKEILIKAKDEMIKAGYMKCQLNKLPAGKLYSGCSLPPDYISKLERPNYGKGEWGKCRRVDFLLVPWREIGAALIYFTGNDYFNRKLRLLALNKKLILNDSGLFKRITYIQGKNVKDKEILIESFNEKKIFKLLGVEYQSPTDRNIGSDDPLIRCKSLPIDEDELQKIAEKEDEMEEGASI